MTAATPSDLRDATFAGLRNQLPAQRAQVYRAWCAWGPCTTRELAQRSNIDILNVRPRTTELYQLGLITLEDPASVIFPLQTPAPHAGEGVYRARTQAEWEDWRAGRPIVKQQELL